MSAQAANLEAANAYAAGLVWVAQAKVLARQEADADQSRRVQPHLANDLSRAAGAALQRWELLCAPPLAATLPGRVLSAALGVRQGPVAPLAVMGCIVQGGGWLPGGAAEARRCVRACNSGRAHPTAIRSLQGTGQSSKVSLFAERQA